jgi:cell division initiation protein
MDLTARDVNEKQFHDAWRGYNQEEVDDFLDRVAETIERLKRENQDLQARVRELDQSVAGSRDTEEMLKKTLVTAQHAAEEAVAKAKARAEELIAEADERMRSADKEINERLAAAEADSRRKILEAERDLARARNQLDDRISGLTRFESELKFRLKTFLEQQLGALDALTEQEPPSIGEPAPPPPTVSAGPAAEKQPETEEGAAADAGPEWNDAVVDVTEPAAADRWEASDGAEDDEPRTGPAGAHDTGELIIEGEPEREPGRVRGFFSRDQT